MSDEEEQHPKVRRPRLGQPPLPAVVVVDANVLQDLNVNIPSPMVRTLSDDERPKNFLELLPYITRLSTIEKVVIPAVCAFEACSYVGGRIINPVFADIDHDKPLIKFFQLVEEGSVPNVEIVLTDEGKPYLDELLQLSEQKKWYKYQKLKFSIGADLGEELMLDYLKWEKDYVGPGVFLSSDGDALNKARGVLSDKKYLITTKQGYPIGCANLSALLYALTRTGVMMDFLGNEKIIFSDVALEINEKNYLKNISMGREPATRQHISERRIKDFSGYYDDGNPSLGHTLGEILAVGAGIDLNEEEDIAHLRIPTWRDHVDDPRPTIEGIDYWENESGRGSKGRG